MAEAAGERLGGLSPAPRCLAGGLGDAQEVWGLRKQGRRGQAVSFYTYVHMYLFHAHLKTVLPVCRLHVLKYTY